MKLNKLTQHAPRNAAWTIMTAALAVVVIAGAAGLIGSNMGFKAVRDYGFNAGATATNRHSIALPHNSPWTGVGGSAALLTYLCQGQVSPVDLTLFAYDNSTAIESYQTINYNCGAFDGADFNLVAGVAYELAVPTDVTGVVLVGSQNPSWTGSTFSNNSSATATNRYNIAITPNTKWATSADLLTAWCTAQVSPVDLTLFSYDNSAGVESYQTINYNCGAFDGADIPLVPFKGYALALPAGSPDVNWPVVPYY